MRVSFTCLAWICFACFPVFSNAQGRKINADNKVSNMEANRKSAKPFTVEFTPAAGYKTADIPELFSQYLELRQGIDELRPAGLIPQAVTVQKYQQYFRNIKVEHGSNAVTVKDGNVLSMIGDVYTIPAETNITASLTEADALTRALAGIHATKYKWELPGEEQHLKRESGNPNATYFPKGELVLVENFRLPGELTGRVSLAYKFDVYAHTPLSRTNIYIDAVSGAILLTDAVIKHANEPAHNNTHTISPLATGTAASRYSGSVSIPTQLTGGSYKLLAAIATESYPLHTMNMSKGTNYGAATEFTDVDNNWTAGEFNNANWDNAALDAHWGAAKVYDYWKNRHSRNSYNNANAVINSYIHFDVAYDNAYWDGVRMTYGDGSNVSGGFTPLTSLDVCAHEIGHAVCQFTSNLVYSRESGGMNEGFSDIWGASVEHYADPAETDAIAKSYFLIGEEISLGAAALRSMSNPKAFFQPDTYLGTYWQDASAGGCPTPSNANDQCGVHTNSGVLNYWFYLLVSGKTGTNDIGNAYAVPAIGWVDAEKIAYLTETLLSSTATYAACRTASINAATTLFGACSLQTEAVTRAWYAVNVGANYVPCTPQIMFNAAAQTVTETGSTGATCLKTKIITVPVKITSAATQAATVSFTVTGTAASGATLDYVISPATVTFPAGSAVDQNLSITINNDGYVEGAETIILNINTVTTTGNASKGNIYQQHTITITDDDFGPAVSTLQTNQVIYSEDFTAPGAWTIANSTGAAAIWRLGNNAGTTPYFTAGNNCAYVSINTTTFTYNTTSGASRLQSPSINTVNKSNLQLTFDFVCRGEIFSGTYYDYGTLYYSIDGGTNWLPTNATFYQNFTTKTTITVPLPVAAENVANLKLGFRWDNDNTTQNQPPFGVDNIVLKGDVRSPALVQTATNTGVSADQKYLGPNATVHFYDNVSGNIMATIENLSSFDYGCTTVEVDRAGTSAQYITGDVSANPKQKVSNKTYKVTPTTNSSTGDYRITLYYTAAEKSGYETSSTRVWLADDGSNNGTKIAKHTGAISAMSVANAITPAIVESAGTFGTGFTITARFNNGFSGFGVGEPPLTLVPVTLLDLTAIKKGSAVEVAWKVAQQINIRSYEIEHSTDGISFSKAGTTYANSLNSSNYSFLHLQPRNGYNFYRLRILDVDGSAKYSDIVKVECKVVEAVYITPNPVSDKFNVVYNGIANANRLFITDVAGREIVSIALNAGEATVPVNAAQLAPGVYILCITDGQNKKVTKKFIKQ